MNKEGNMVKDGNVQASKPAKMLTNALWDGRFETRSRTVKWVREDNGGGGVLGRADRARRGWQGRDTM